MCPSCGVGARGPARPRRDATVRFCLPCSAVSSVLVARACPALARARSRPRRRDPSSWVVLGVDVPAEVQSYWSAVRAAGEGVVAPPPPRPPDVTLRSRAGVASTGRAHHREGRVHISHGECVHEFREVLLHELVHIARGRPPRQVHGPVFKRILCDAAHRLWGVRVDPQRSRYGTDRAIVDALRGKTPV